MLRGTYYAGAIIREVIAENPAAGVDGEGVDKLERVIRSIIPGSSFKVRYIETLHSQQRSSCLPTTKPEWSHLIGRTCTVRNMLHRDICHSRHTCVCVYVRICANEIEKQDTIRCNPLIRQDFRRETSCASCLIAWRNFCPPPRLPPRRPSGGISVRCLRS